MSETQEKNLKTLAFFKEFCNFQLLNYQKTLLKKIVKTNDEHGSLLSLINKSCTKLRI